MNNQVQITYDPYQKKIQYEYRSNPKCEWEALHGNSALTKTEFCEGTLQNKATDIVKILLKDYCGGSRGLDLFFRGTTPDWEDLKAVIQQVDNNRKITCTGQGGQLLTAQEVLPKIEAIFKRLSEEFGTLSDPSIKKSIDQYLEAIQPEIVLCVVGTYSSGKSAFINALIGEELLPGAVDPTTAHIFKIVAIPQGTWQDTEIRFQYRGRDVILRFQPGGYDLDNYNNLPDLELKYHLDRIQAEGKSGSAYIYEVLELLNRFDAELAAEENAVPDGQIKRISDQIEIRTPFYRSSLPLDKFQFVILDTPGSDTANYEKHIETLRGSLNSQTNALPIFVTQVDKMDSEGVKKLRDQISDINALDNSNILIVANKADTLSTQSLEKKSQKSESLAAQKGAEKRLFYLSSVIGLGAKKEDMDRCVFEDTSEIFEKERSSFLSGKKRLYLYDSLPQERYAAIRKQSETVAKNGEDYQKLFYNSGLWAVENELELFAQRYAIYHKCHQAQGYLTNAIAKLASLQNMKNSQQKKLREKLDSERTDKEGSLREQLETLRAAWKKEQFDACVKQQTAICNKWIGFQSEKQLESELKQQWENLKKVHKKDANEAVRALKTWADNKVSSTVDSCIDALYRFANHFWAQRIETYKMKCIRIVQESSDLSAEEKAFIEDYILEIQLPLFQKVKFSFCDGSLHEYKLFKFEWVKLKRKDCVNDLKKAIKTSILDYNVNFFSGIEETVSAWDEKFYKELEQKLPEFNPDLSFLDQAIQVCEEELRALSSSMDRLRCSESMIKNLFIFNDKK